MKTEMLPSLPCSLDQSPDYETGDKGSQDSAEEEAEEGRRPRGPQNLDKAEVCRESSETDAEEEADLDAGRQEGLGRVAGHQGASVIEFPIVVPTSKDPCQAFYG